jgi:hypothetical protein
MPRGLQTVGPECRDDGLRRAKQGRCARRNSLALWSNGIDPEAVCRTEAQPLPVDGVDSGMQSSVAWQTVCPSRHR